MKDEKLVVFGKRLKELRLSVNQTQRSMGELLGCTISNYQKMEYGEINIPITSLMTLADYFGVTTDYLLGRSDDRGLDGSLSQPSADSSLQEGAF